MKTKTGIVLTPEQDYVVHQLIKGTRNEQVQSLGGYAGCGKTTVLSVLADKLPGWKTCAFTGRAAHVMRTKGMKSASTIHSLIYHPHPNKDGAPNFELKSPHELGHLRGFLIDEASMVGKDLYNDLLSFGKPILLVGDHGQLPPVKSEAIYLMEDPMYRLEMVHRNAGEIAFFAEHLREGGWPKNFKTDRQIRLIDKAKVSDKALLRADRIIVATNRSRVGINEKVRALLGRKELLELLTSARK
jgi:exodeoxyribonuclease-5